MRQSHLTLSLVAASMLAACGGSGTSGPTIDNSMARGSLFASPPNLVPIPLPNGTYAKQLDPATFTTMLEAANPGITRVTGTPACSITTYYMKYGTVGGANETTSATGAIMVPSGTSPQCSGPRPVVLYAHGTTANKAFNMSNLRDNSEAALVAAIYAAQGFIVVAPNYAGYDVSSLNYHPYLNAVQQSNDMVDSLRAARKAFPAIGAQDAGLLFVNGYSQGGFVAMATQRAMQTTYASEFKVTGFAGGSGPYALSAFGDAIFAGAPPLGGTVFLPLLSTSWQKSFGGLYSSPSDLYSDPYAANIESLLPGNFPTFDALFSTGALPPLAMFAADSQPQQPGFGAFFGSGNLVKTSFRNAYLADAVANPCNQNPANPLSCTPGHAFRKTALMNDLRTFVPTSPTMLCGGNADPSVFFFNSQLTSAFFTMNGLPQQALITLDVDSQPTGVTDPFAAVKVGFSQAKTATAQAAIAAGKDPRAAVATAYHGSLVPPFCAAAARGFFMQLLPSK